MTTMTIKLPSANFSLGRLLSRTVLEPLGRMRARQAAYEELMSLDDHMLSDIGITRGQIPGMIRGAFAPEGASNENKPVAAA